MSSSAPPDLTTPEGVAARFREYLGDDADQSREAKKRRRILAAAYALFLSQGYRKTSVDDVAKKAHVAKGTVYLYFKSKSDLLVHSVAFEKKSLMAQMTRILSEQTPTHERLREFIRLTLIAARDMPLSARLLTGDVELLEALEDIDPDEMERSRREGRDFIGQLIEWAAPGVLDERERTLRADVLAAMGFFSARILDARVRHDRSLDEFVDALARMLAAGAREPAEDR